MNVAHPDRVQVRILPATKLFPKYTVIVYVLKFDKIRQESYWVTEKVRTYYLKSDAEAFASRFSSSDSNGE
jgi:hypothetical protein